jgi:hypothetical protein
LVLAESKSGAAVTTVDLAWLRTHGGHEVKYMTYAAAQFRIRSDARDFGSVAMQDSCLTRARALLDFVRSGDQRNGHLEDFYASSGPEEWTDLERELFDFVSRVPSHVSSDRDNAAVAGLA